MSEAKLVNADGMHWYQVDDKFLPSVTTHLSVYPKPELYNWKADIGAEKADRICTIASESGTLIHNTISTMIEQPNIDVSLEDWTNDQVKMLKGWFQFMEANEPKIYATEKTVYDFGLGSAGTLDLILDITKEDVKKKISKGKYIVDIKTGKGLYKYYDLQLAAYQEMHYQMTGEKLETAILWLKKTATKKFFQFVPVDTTGKLDVYRACKTIWEDKNGNPKGPKEKIKRLKKVSMKKYKKSIAKEVMV